MIKKILCFLFGHRIYRPVEGCATLHFSINDGREIFVDMCKRCKLLFYSELVPIQKPKEQDDEHSL